MSAWSRREGAGLVERARPGDADAIAALLALSMPDAWTEAMVFETLARDLGLVLRAPGKGLLACALVRTTDIEAEILQLAVAPEKRRVGLGRVMLEQVLAACIGSGVRAAWLEVRTGNAAARALYAAAGFVEVGRRARYYRDGEDAVVMRKDLTMPPPPG